MAGGVSLSSEGVLPGGASGLCEPASVGDAGWCGICGVPVSKELKEPLLITVRQFGGWGVGREGRKSFPLSV